MRAAGHDTLSNAIAVWVQTSSRRRDSGVHAARPSFSVWCVPVHDIRSGGGGSRYGDLFVGLRLMVTMEWL